MSMNGGYKAFLALTLATAACWRAKAQNPDLEQKKDSMEVKNNQTPLAQDSTISFNEAQQQYVSQNNVLSDVNTDSVVLEKIKQQMIADGPETVRFIAHFENIKMHAYWDRVAKKWTIGFGNTTNPNGRPIRGGDKIKDEAELMLYFNDYFLEKVAPHIAKFFPNYLSLNKEQRIAICDLCWNAGVGVLSNTKEYDASVQKLSESQRQEVAQLLQNKNEGVTFNGRVYTLNDISEWRNLSLAAKTALQPIYPNLHIVKGDNVNHTYSEKFAILNEQQRGDVFKFTSMLQNTTNLPALTLRAPQFHSTWNSAQVNDTTIRYRGFVTEYNYTINDVPMWYKLQDSRQEDICKELAVLNGSVCYNGHIYTCSGIPAKYFSSKEDQKAVQKSLGSDDLLVRKPSDNKKKPVLSNLAYELNLYAITQSPVDLERVATRMTTYIRSRGKVVPALQKRANIRAQMFLGTLHIDWGKVNIGASYSVAKNDLGDPQAICDTIEKCTYGKNFEDSIRDELKQTSKRAHQAIRRRAQPQRKTQTRVLARAGARGR